MVGRQPHAINENTLEGVAAIAEYLGKSYSTVHKWIKYHNLPAMISPRGEWFTTKMLVNAWIVTIGREDVEAWELNPFDLNKEVSKRFARASYTIQNRIDADKQSSLEFLYYGKTNQGRRFVPVEVTQIRSRPQKRSA